MRSPWIGSLVFSLAVACGSSQTPAPQTAPTPAPAPAPAPAPTPEPAPAPAPAAHTEARLDHGHITLNHQILFDTDSDHIQESQSQTVLSDLIALLHENPAIRRIRVEGHTDLRGDARRNQDLSQRRAQAVADYLRTHGFSSVTFEATGFGPSQPLCRESNDACHERNRRVEFTITDPPAP